MKAEELYSIIGSDFYTGVPDSQLRALCDFLTDTWGTDKKHHIIAANEGNCAAIAAGYHLATGRLPVVYMQNSGEGNMINPFASLLCDKVYAVPVLFIIGWRGEPGVKDEPQHIFQGEITVSLLENIGIDSFVIGKETSDDEVREVMAGFRKRFAEGRCAAFVIRKGALSYSGSVDYHNGNAMIREEIIRHIVGAAGEDVIVSTTGKASRELFEIRESLGMSHKYDFLTVGSMGHSSSIALGIAVNKPGKRVWCIDGDGAALMHMGAMAVIGSTAPENMIHVVINNGAHETVGGMPTAAGKISLVRIAEACGYRLALSANNYEELDNALETAKRAVGPSFIEAGCAIGSRADLGRPTLSPASNKAGFMEYLKADTNFDAEGK